MISIGLGGGAIPVAAGGTLPFTLPPLSRSRLGDPPIRFQDDCSSVGEVATLEIADDLDQELVDNECLRAHIRPTQRTSPAVHHTWPAWLFAFAHAEEDLKVEYIFMQAFHATNRHVDQFRAGVRVVELNGHGAGCDGDIVITSHVVSRERLLNCRQRVFSGYAE
ncbi:hypothetical protein AC579_1775 [Pseudocercospora musae]|uniref:Uncharacterized protein n=1 Tax=Pseudocercospora musae TaxID=113226 RepID=A0A139IPC6_9PEZI|nr:hypothetical protein AC579_1775 [Pseudocercospora musae]